MTLIELKKQIDEMLQDGVAGNLPVWMHTCGGFNQKEVESISFKYEKNYGSNKDSENMASVFALRINLK